MSIIPLRQYNREIEGMVESGQIAEAVAHCRHILQIYPKHITTYRLLGKIHLETQQYSDAVDIFQRLLVVVPDDFIAHVGMSIIREDENNLDAAIWHMERAFETQPSNSAIQEELRRLYGRRDGIEPPKIRLTRGALARMYARGNLYEQAIVELRTALSDDPQRVDLQVLLAQMYYHTRQLVESIEICSIVLKKYPYCQEANRLLAAILPHTDRASDTEIYRQRLLAMDPYYASISPEIGSTENIPENAVTIQRLDYKPGQAVAGEPAQPAWASSLGIAFEEASAEQLPEWLQEGEPQALSAGQESLPPAMPSSSWEPSDDQPGETPLDDEEIPDWMKEAGWQSASSEGAERPAPIPDEQDGEEITKGDIPEWLKDLAPAGVFDEELPPLEDDEELSLPWLEEQTPGASDTVKNWLEETSPEEPGQGDSGAQPDQVEGDLPDWLREKDVESSADKSTEPPVQGEEQLPGWLADSERPLSEPSGVTDWLRSAALPEESLTEEPTPLEPTQEELPDWLQETTSPQAETTPPAEEFSPEEPEQQIPAWLQEWDNATPESPTAAETASQAEESELTGEDAALSWLDSLAAEQGSEETESITTPEEPIEIPSDFTQEDNILEEPSPASPLEEVPDWIQDDGSDEAAFSPPSDEPTTPEEAIVAEELPDWMSETPPSEETPDEELSEIPELPDWLLEVDTSEEDTASGTSADDIETSQAEFLESETSVPEVPQIEDEPREEMMPDLSDEDAALAWLENLAAQHGAKEEELITKPEDRLETPPDWIAEQSASSQPSEDELLEELPAWLQEEPPTPVPETPVESPLKEETPPDQQEGPATTEPGEAEEVFPSEEVAIWIPEEPAIEPVDEAISPEEVSEELQGIPAAPVSETPLEAVMPEEIPAELKEEAPDTTPEIPIDVTPLEEVPAILQEEPISLTPEAPSEALPSEELPTWLQEESAIPTSETPTTAVPADEIPEWLQEESDIPTQKTTSEAISPEELPDQSQEETPTSTIGLIDINHASLKELETLPGIGFVKAQNILGYREENGTFDSIDDLEKVPGITPAIMDGIRPLVTITPVMIPPLPVLDEDELILAEARQAMEEERCGASVELYSTLIHKSQYLDLIIHDLLNALYRFPIDVDIWQILGDAYLRNDNLQEALDAYIKAEDLLR